MRVYNTEHLEHRHYVPGEAFIFAEHADEITVASFEETFQSLLKEYIDSPFEVSIQSRQFYLDKKSGDPEKFGLPFFSITPIKLSDEDVDNLVRSFFNRRNAINSSNPNFQIKAITPNWFATPSQTGSTDPGPGSWPVPAFPINPDDHDFRFIDPIPDRTHPASRLNAMKDIKDGLAARERPKQDVHVAILDSFPDTSLDDKDLIIRCGEHPILSTLPSVWYPIKPPASLTDELHWRCVSGERHGFLVRDHGYEMTDHGMFVAGIIHTLAPKARLYPVKVLNKYGVGTIGTVIDALKDLLRFREEERLEKFLINMSLTFTLPRDAKHKKGLISQEMANDLENDQIALDMMAGICWLYDKFRFSLLDDSHSYMVAAAGNDWDYQTSQPVARFPAALPEVLGVGAFNKNVDLDNVYFLARYTNQSDWTRGRGVIAYGGNAIMHDEDCDPFMIADPELGMLGLYISPYFPDRNNPRESKIENENCWARWSGTSFAAPVVTGVLAFLGQQGKTFDDAVKIIRDCAGPEFLSSDPFGEVEDVLPLQQKFTP